MNRSRLSRIVAQYRRSARQMAEGDVQHLAPAIPPFVVHVAFGIMLAGLGILLRLLIDRIWSGAGPFGLMVPVVLVATLFGRLSAGMVCLTITSVYAWYYVLPAPRSFAFENPSDGPRVIVNIGAGIFVVLLAELFRRTMQASMSDREFLLRELEHRVKNNFASVVSFLRLQMRQHADDPIVLSALQTAIGRVESYSTANTYLYRQSRYSGDIDMQDYLGALVKSLEEASLVENDIRIDCEFADIVMPREQAISVGLIVNELVTNAIKHAFGDGRSGHIDIKLSRSPDGAMLTVSDNGHGMQTEDQRETLGTSLVRALARQAEGEIEMVSGEDGTSVTLLFHPDFHG
ncbi:sensor histidine kinase [Tepidamorphus sp. 3E244]|uniref:sensor histidine kinase n=1 Tax=Tepidamorphus sp. 3E244 TaxID=3385498 RepID=UPI0038FCD9F3